MPLPTRRGGRPAGPPSSGSDAVDEVVLLLREIRAQAGLSVDGVHDLLKASGELEAHELPGKSTLHRKLKGIGLKNERRLVEAVVAVCVPDEQRAEVLRSRAVERLREAWSRDTDPQPTTPTTTTEDGGDVIAELIRVQRTLIEVQTELAAARLSAIEAEGEAARLRALLPALSTPEAARAIGPRSTPAVVIDPTHGVVEADLSALAARLTATEAERDETREAADSALHRLAVAEGRLTAHATSSASPAPAQKRVTTRADPVGMDVVRRIETGRSGLEVTTAHPGSDMRRVAGGISEQEAQAPALEEDVALLEVLAEMLRLDPDGSRMSSVIDSTARHVLDPTYTGRYLWSQLTKVEKIGFSTAVHNRMQREFSLPDGQHLDFAVAGHEVGAKFSSSGNWMFSPEDQGELCLVVRANVEQGRWSIGLLRASRAALTAGANRDQMRGLNPRGRTAVRWIHHDLPLPEHALRRLPADTVSAIFAEQSGQDRIEELFVRAERTVISSADLAAVTMREDVARRAREARANLAHRGVLVLSGAYPHYSERFADFGLPALAPGNWTSVRLTPAASGHDGSPTVLLDGTPWRLAQPGDPEIPLPPTAGLA